MKPMNTAPKEEYIEVFAHGEWWPVIYHDCQWMRDEPEYESIDDGWAIFNADGPGHIELNEAEGWRTCDVDPLEAI